MPPRLGVCARAADAVARAGANDHAKINRAMQATDYKGLCNYAVDENNVLARAIYVYAYQPDKSKELMKSFQLPFIPSSASRMLAQLGVDAAPGEPRWGGGPSQITVR